METEKYREWIVTSQYEALAPEEEAELTAHLAAHPESRQFQEEVQAIRRGLDAWKPAEVPLDPDEILAQVQSFPSVVQTLPRRRLAGMIWRRALGAAAGLVVAALIWTQGLAIELGGHRIFALNAPASHDTQALMARINEINQKLNAQAPSGEQLTRLIDQRINHQVSPALGEIVAAVKSYQETNGRALAAFRQETNQRFEEAFYPRPRIGAPAELDPGLITNVNATIQSR